MSYIALPQNESVNCAYFSIWPGPPGSTVIAESLFLPDFYHGVKIKKLPALLWRYSMGWISTFIFILRIT
ncbi:hypothetical protein DZC26_22000 [Escherichia coli]|nr:hypothetical protein DZC26_22000 [Escherichia coli]